MIKHFLFSDIWISSDTFGQHGYYATDSFFLSFSEISFAYDAVSMKATEHLAQCNIIPSAHVFVVDNPPQDSSASHRKQKIIISVSVVVLGLFLLFTSLGIAWWQGYIGNRILKEEGDYFHIVIHLK